MSNASPDLVEILMEFEEQTGIVVPDEIAERFQTVDEIVEYFKRRQEE